mmetsp:Transcript_65948/g.193381  ORF Transcript_65948/g.193381 Transcript_65948/m.193381 type:complete len:237 (+) Transcript_65948:1475-2185(+)
MTLPKPPAPRTSTVFSDEMCTGCLLLFSLMPSRTCWNCSPTPLLNMYDMSPVLSRLKFVREPCASHPEEPPIWGPKRACRSLRSLESQGSTCGPFWPFFGDSASLHCKVGSDARLSSSAISAFSAEGALEDMTWIGVFPAWFGCCSSSSDVGLFSNADGPSSSSGRSPAVVPWSAHDPFSGGCRRTSAIWKLPILHASCRGFSQFVSVWVGSAPARSRMRTQSRWPLLTATCSAVA